MDNCKVLGIKKTEIGEGKNKGKVACNYFLQTTFTDYELENSVCTGVKVTIEFSYKEFDVNIGDEVTLVYEKGFQDKAVLANMVPFAPTTPVKNSAK